MSSKPSNEADLFGIKDVTNYDVMGTKEREEIDEEQFNKKYAYMNNLNRADSEETVLKYPHGHIRLDKDNQPKYHGQFDEDNKKIRFDIDALEALNEELNDATESTSKALTKELTKKKLEENEINQLMQSITRAKENQHSQTEANTDDQVDHRRTARPKSFESNKPRRIKVDTSNADIYDFDPIKRVYADHKLVYNVNLMYKTFNFKFEDQWSKWIRTDEECSKSPLAELSKQQRILLNPILGDKYADMQSGKLRRSRFRSRIDEEDEPKDVLDDSSLYTPLKSLSELEEMNEEEPTEGDEQPEVKKPEMNIQSIFEREHNEQQKSTEQVTALEYLRKIKNKEVEVKDKHLKTLIDRKSSKAMNVDNLTFKPAKMEYDTKGFRNYKNQPFSMYKLTNVDRALYLETETFFNNFGFVALNKPYGLICPGDEERMGNEISDRKMKPVNLTSFIDAYARLISMQDKKRQLENSFDDPQNPKLYPIYKLDRNCTGVYILAKNKATAIKLHELFKTNQVSLFYDAITKSVPNLEKATIDIPIEQNRRDMKYRRMVLRPILPTEFQTIVRPSRNADKAITNYRILKSNKSAAYLELNPITSIRHQLRVHLGFGLRTPILGDHLYDNEERVTYQKLPPDMLLGLNVRPTKTLQLPLHLYCKLIILNGMGTNGKDVFLKTDPSNFFKENLKSLKLN